MASCHSPGVAGPQVPRCSGGRPRPGVRRVGWALARPPPGAPPCRLLNATPAPLAAFPAPTVTNRSASRTAIPLAPAAATAAGAAATSTVERRAADVAVLGDSCIALAAAFSFARRGKKVILLPDLGLTAPRPPAEVFRPLHLPHPDAAMVSLASEAGAYWRGLQAQAAGSGLQLLADCRSLDLGPLRAGGGGGGDAEAAGEVLGRLQDACKAAGVRLGSLKSEELTALFPQLRLPGGVAGLLQPEGGVLNSSAARSLLLNLGERQGVLLRDRLVLRGWRDAGSHFVLRASGSLLPDAVSVFEVEQLLLAPSPERSGGWPAHLLRMFGADVPALQVIQSSFGRCASAPELTSLPVWRAIGLSPLGGGDGGGGGSRSSAAPPEQQQQQQQLLLQVVSGLPARLSAPGSSSASLKLGLGLAAAGWEAAGGGTAVQGLNPWVWQPGTPDRSGLLSAHRLASQLLRGLGPPLLPSNHNPSAPPPGPDQAWGDAALHIATPDGWPALGYLPGLEPGRLMFAATASGCGGPDPAADSLGPVGSSGESKDTRSPRAESSRPASSGGGGGEESQPQQQQPASARWLLGGRSVLADGYQLSPLLAKVAVEMMCGAARPQGEVEWERLDLGRPAMGAVARAEGLDSWEGLARWQGGEAFRQEAEAVAAGDGDAAAACERAEARARGARMLGADAGAEDEAAREAEERRRGSGPKVFTIGAPPS